MPLRAPLVDATRMGATLSAALLASALFTSGCAGCTRRLQRDALEKQSLDMCDSVPHRAGDGCRQSVQIDFDRCSAPLLAKQIGAAEFAKCLGFALPESPTATPRVVGSCAAPLIKAHISVSLARTTAWDSSTPRELDGQTLYVANEPTLRTSDVTALNLEEEQNMRLVSLTLSAEAAARLARDTHANVGQFIVVSLNQSEVVAKIATGISGERFVIAADEVEPSALCSALAP